MKVKKRLPPAGHLAGKQTGHVYEAKSAYSETRGPPRLLLLGMHPVKLEMPKEGFGIKVIRVAVHGLCTMCTA